MTTVESILTAAAELSVEDRVRLIDELAATVPDDHPPTLSPEWEAEIDRRWEAYKNGEVKSIPWETVRQELLAQEY